MRELKTFLDFTLEHIVRKIIQSEITGGESAYAIEDKIKRMTKLDKPESEKPEKENVINFDTKETLPQNLCNIDEFDVDASVEKHDNITNVLRDWFEFENREYPEDFGIQFSGWDKLTKEKKSRLFKI